MNHIVGGKDRDGICDQKNLKDQILNTTSGDNAIHSIHALWIISAAELSDLPYGSLI